ncbi:hypothetical protein PAT3040_03390 [Paenibacillus agaridevorans]|uniref:Uncharacterized protein n=1 Tax=Paenibacillus agaridevorans TaxID=171404 RepID=A0A2R5EQ28_9BACL|nr:hypothetical protein PAT3040_03390 [Paenibacillus agaridevorans]
MQTATNSEWRKGFLPHGKGSFLFFGKVCLTVRVDRFGRLKLEKVCVTGGVDRCDLNTDKCAYRKE